MLKYGSDKPDLRNPLRDRRRDRGVPRLGLRRLRQGDRRRRSRARDSGAGAADRAAQLLRQAQRLGARRGRAGPRLRRVRGGRRQGPIAKFLDEPRLAACGTLASAEDGDAVFFVCDKKDKAAK